MFLDFEEVVQFRWVAGNPWMAVRVLVLDVRGYLAGYSWVVIGRDH